MYTYYTYMYIHIYVYIHTYTYTYMCTTDPCASEPAPGCTQGLSSAAGMELNGPRQKSETSEGGHYYQYYY